MTPLSSVVLSLCAVVVGWQVVRTIRSTFTD